MLLNDDTLRIIETEEGALKRQLQEWKLMFPGGIEGREELLSLKQQQQQQQQQREGGKESIPKTGLNKPKHGKEDEKNEVHVGGNTWAGGVGGSDTAGLGGRGGPYRLDKGHVVHQVSEEMKKQVGEEAREEAARMGREALAQRLKEIGMSEGDWFLYEGIMKRVNQQVGQLREILREGGRKGKDRGKEREWRRNQAQGELDDNKLVDGMAGERLVFKRRADVEEEEDESWKGRKKDGEKKGKSKRRMLFVMDTSGSMYRFNGEDGRLDRMLEVATMIMESFEYDDRGRKGEDDDEVEYAIRAHSGDSAKVPLIEFGRPPKTRKDKVAVLEKMAAHAQYCLAGDNTLRATEEAAAELAAYQQQRMEEGREGGSNSSYLFVVSDANFERYGIPPRRLGEALVRHGASVRGHVFLIATLGEEAKEAVRQMPVGRAHLCLEVSALPGAMKKIFVEELNR
eukprot:evm.model.NODE_19120_length_25721_cov_24.254967.6